MNWWIRDLGDFYVLMVNDSKVAVFFDRETTIKFMNEFGVAMEVIK